MKAVNAFDNNKAAITIPDEVANRNIPVPEPAKKIRLEEKPEESAGLDLETMLSSFVDKPIDAWAFYCELMF